MKAGVGRRGQVGTRARSLSAAVLRYSEHARPIRTAIAVTFRDSRNTTHRKEAMDKLCLLQQSISYLTLALAIASSAMAQTSEGRDSGRNARYEKGVETLGKITWASGAQVVEGVKEVEVILPVHACHVRHDCTLP